MLAATAIEQGRIAALAAFGRARLSPTRLLPYGIQTIPEISFVGPTDRALAATDASYVVGRGHFRDLPRAEIAGDRSGLLKLLVDTETRRVLGVHIFGTSATELVHLGQAFMAGGLAVDDVAELVFNVPTFSDAYKLAALDAREQLATPVSRAA
jgi:NAD(P) transhydrogenase